MELNIADQTLYFLYSAAFGICAGAVYDLFRFLRLLFRPKKIAGSILDFLFCLICTAGALIFVLLRSGGSLRVFLLAGVILGAALYFLTLSTIFMSMFKPTSKKVRISYFRAKTGIKNYRKKTGDKRKAKKTASKEKRDKKRAENKARADKLKAERKAENEKLKAENDALKKAVVQAKLKEKQELENLEKWSEKPPEKEKTKRKKSKKSFDL